MESVRTLVRACHAVSLVLLVSLGTASAQMALSTNGQQLNTFVGRGVALADCNGDRLPDVFVVYFTSARTLPRDRSFVAHPADVWLNASRRVPVPAFGLTR